MNPAPKSKWAAGYKLAISYPSAIIGSPRLSKMVAVVDIAEALIDSVHEGLYCLISAAIPATWGVAMLVPDNRAKLYPKEPDKFSLWIYLKKLGAYKLSPNAESQDIFSFLGGKYTRHDWIQDADGAPSCPDLVPWCQNVRLQHIDRLPAFVNEIWSPWRESAYSGGSSSERTNSSLPYSCFPTKHDCKSSLVPVCCLFIVLCYNLKTKWR